MRPRRTSNTPRRLSGLVSSHTHTRLCRDRASWRGGEGGACQTRARTDARCLLHVRALVAQRAPHGTRRALESACRTRFAWPTPRSRVARQAPALRDQRSSDTRGGVFHTAQGGIASAVEAFVTLEAFVRGGVGIETIITHTAINIRRLGRRGGVCRAREVAIVKAVASGLAHDTCKVFPCYTVKQQKKQDRCPRRPDPHSHGVHDRIYNNRLISTRTPSITTRR